MSHEEYSSADEVIVAHDQLKSGNPCPTDCGGTLRAIKPGSVIRVTGGALAKATKYIVTRLRCNLCGELFRADLPAGVSPVKKYDTTLKATLCFSKYYLGMPFHRQEDSQWLLGCPLPASTQFKLCADVWVCATPVFGHLETLAANAKLIHHDDTGAKVLSLMNSQEAADVSKKQRKAMYTTGMLAELTTGERIALFYTGRAHAGENLRELLSQRTVTDKKVLQMCDAHWVNKPKDVETILGNCLSHGFRRFDDLLEYYPEPCQHVIKELGEVYGHDAYTKQKQMTDIERFHYHRQHSKPIMLRLYHWLRRQEATSTDIEPNGVLGEALRYMLRNWKALRRFLTVPGMPLDNNVIERALKIPIRSRKASYFYKTERGAQVGGELTSVIYTARLAGENPLDYLVALQDHAGEVAANPGSWLPWTYRATLQGITSQAS